jgi:alpha-tubulin suppressor-like RCC1 family protein
VSGIDVGMAKVGKTSPTAVPGLTGVAEIARKTGDTMLCWGYNGSGQLGDGTKTSTSFPTDVPGLTDVADISLGGSHTFARKKDGSVHSWGNNLYGQLGLGGAGEALSPVVVKW